MPREVVRLAEVTFAGHIASTEVDSSAILHVRENDDGSTTVIFAVDRAALSDQDVKDAPFLKVIG